MSDDMAIDRASIRQAYIAADWYSVKLPSERNLAEEFSVAYPTLRHAMAILRERALILTIHGRGTFVASVSAGNRTDPLADSCLIVIIGRLSDS